MSNTVVKPHVRNIFIRRWKWILVLILTATTSLSVGVSAYVGWNLTHPIRDPIDTLPSSLGLSYKEISFKSNVDNVILSGWWIPASNNGITPLNKTIIFAHGYGNNRLQRNVPGLAIAEYLVKRGYNVMMFDFRNSGESGGNLTSVGQFEKYDLLGAIGFAKSLKSDAKIILFGFSMGASTSLLAAAASPDVAGVIADSPFDNLKPYLKTNLPVWSHLPNFPFTSLIMAVIPPLTGMNPDDSNPLAVVQQIAPRPILFIHGDSDTAIPMVNSQNLLAAAHNDHAELWVVHGADHVKSYITNPKAYLEKIILFLNEVK